MPDKSTTAKVPPDRIVPSGIAADSVASDKVVPAKVIHDNSVEDNAVPDKVVRSDEEWRRLLSAEQYRVLRAKGTERPFVNEYDEHFAPGTYSCAACGQALFDSETKFNSGCGWPSFYAAKAGDRVKLHRDASHGVIRTEVTCARCDSHLGHVFDDAPRTPTGQRYCINSVSLKFTPAGQGAASGDASSK